MRGVLPQVTPLMQGFVNQRNFAVLQITQAAVNQATGGGGGAAAEVILFEYYNPQAAQSRIASNARAVDPGTNDRKIEVFRGGHFLARQLMMPIKTRQGHLALGYRNAATSGDCRNLTDIAGLGDKIINLGDTTR